MGRNRGEWSESYVVIRLLADGKMYMADDNGKKINNEWMNIIDIIRRETEKRMVTYKYCLESTDINITVNGEEIINVAISEFLSNADLLKKEIKIADSRTFDVSDSLKKFFDKIEIKKFKAKSVNKSDIVLSVADPRTSMIRKNIGFSIKSKMGKDPTLFNAASASGAKYLLSSINSDMEEKINNMYDKKGHVATRERCKFIKDSGCKIEFAGFQEAKRAKCKAFKENLELINPNLVMVINWILYNHFFNDIKKKNIIDFIEQIIKDNPCNLLFPETKYPYMVKQFLYAAYCGMTASTVWNGRGQVNGGYITVNGDGEVVANYALESDAFKEFLYRASYLELPDTDEKHGNYAKVYMENGEYYFNLNFQIRLK